MSILTFPPASFQDPSSELCQWSSSHWTVFIAGNYVVQASRNCPHSGLLQVSLPGQFKSRKSTPMSINSPRAQGPRPPACSGFCLHELARAFDSLSKLFPTGEGRYLPSCLSPNLALVILETVSGGRRGSWGRKNHIARQGSGQVFSGSPGWVRWISSPKGKEAGSALLEDLNQSSDSVFSDLFTLSHVLVSSSFPIRGLTVK